MSGQSRTQGLTRILFCEGNIDGTIGGSYFSLLFLAAGLDRARYEPIVVFRSRNSLIPRYEDCGIRTLVKPIPVPTTFRAPEQSSGALYRNAYPFLRLIQKLINFVKFLPLEAYHCRKLLREERIDILHLNNSVIRNHEWMLGALLAKTPCITHERGINTSYSRVSQFLARKIDGVICISQAVKDSLGNGGVRPRSCPVIYNGIDPAEMTVTSPDVEGIRARHSIPPGARLIGVVGNIKQWKGQETAVRALPAVLAKHPETYCLFIGDTSEDDKPYLSTLEQLMDANGIGDRVVFTGYTSDVPDYMNALDVVLHTSIEPEPFGRVLIEAMALEKPLIGAAAGAVPEIIKDGETGLMFEPGNPEDLAHCINELLGSADAATRMGRAGYERMVNLFHIGINVSKTQEFYASLLE